MSEKFYRIQFLSHSGVYEIYAQTVCESQMFGFVQISDLVFGNPSQLLVDPSVERLRSEFKNVKRFFIPAHAIIRVDEMEESGVAKIYEIDSKKKTAIFPNDYIPYGKKDD